MMKVNYVSAYTSKSLSSGYNEREKAQYGMKIEVNNQADCKDITSLANILLSYNRLETLGSLVVAGYDELAEDFNTDIERARQVFEEEVNQLDLRGVQVDLTEIRQLLFNE